MSLMEQLHGILIIDKPGGMSSAQCVGRIKRLGQKKIGHAGTLDPMATGVLIVLLGHATKLSGYLLEGGEKRYEGVARLGLVTDTWDAEGQILEERAVPAAGTPEGDALEADVRREVAAWIEVREQPVPPYSAAKHQGQPLYRLARAGKDVPLKTKAIQISRAELQWVKLPDVRFRVTCSSGSYIRSLAHSLGMRLGCGATLTELTRLYSHPFGLDEAHSLDDVLADPEGLPRRVLPLSAALPGWPVFTVNPAEEAAQRNGRALMHHPGFGAFEAGQRALTRNASGEPLALVEARVQDGQPVWVMLRGLFTPSTP